MRAYIIAAAAALALTACGKTEPAADVAATPASAPAAEAPAHDMSTMDHDMTTADAADDANTAETIDGFTFHTYPAKTESVHLPSAGAGSWTATATDAALVTVGAAAETAMPDGATHHVVKVDTKASGNADVKFERRETADAAAPVVETRTIHFMIH